MACRMASACTWSWVLPATAALLTAALLCLPFSAAGSLEEGECSADELEDCHSDGSELQAAGKWQQYLELINSSLADYTDCWSETREMECGCYGSLIEGDLEVWRDRGGIKWEEFEAAKQPSYRAVHYQIIDHKLYRQQECMFGPRCKGIEHFLLKIIDDLPNVEMVINVKDWPMSPKHAKLLPVFSFSKTMQHYDIMYPAWSFWAGGPAISLEPRGLGRWDQKRETITKAAAKWPWDEKTPVAFFRGSRTCAERDPLVLLSREKPHLVDAAYTKNQAWKSDKDTLGAPAAEEVSLEDHCQYKYLVNFRGVAASFRLKHLFLCHSLVFHVGSEWVEFFYPALRPWVHYIPVGTDLTDTEDLLSFAKKNNRIAKALAERGFEFIWNHLRMEDVLCYWKRLLTQYSKLITWTVKREPNLMHIQR